MERATPILFIGLLLGLVGVSCRHEVIGPEPLPSAAEPEPETFWELSGVDSVVDAEYSPGDGLRAWVIPFLATAVSVPG